MSQNQIFVNTRIVDKFNASLLLSGNIVYSAFPFHYAAHLSLYPLLKTFLIYCIQLCFTNQDKLTYVRIYQAFYSPLDFLIFKHMGILLYQRSIQIRNTKYFEFL